MTGRTGGGVGRDLVAAVVGATGPDMSKMACVEGTQDAINNRERAIVMAVSIVIFCVQHKDERLEQALNWTAAEIMGPNRSFQISQVNSQLYTVAGRGVARLLLIHGTQPPIDSSVLKYSRMPIHTSEVHTE